MADGLPMMEMEYSVTGAPIVIVEEAEANDVAQLIALAPALTDPHWVFAFAQMVNHLAQGEDYELIIDPAAFKARYMAAYDAEDPTEVVGPGIVRLHNYAMPDFATLHPPKMEGATLVFFAENIFMGLPYRVTMALDGKPDYQPAAVVE